MEAARIFLSLFCVIKKRRTGENRCKIVNNDGNTFFIFSVLAYAECLDNMFSHGTLNADHWQVEWADERQGNQILFRLYFICRDTIRKNSYILMQEARRNVKILEDTFRFYYRCAFGVVLRVPRNYVMCYSCATPTIYILDNVTFVLSSPHTNDISFRKSAENLPSAFTTFVLCFHQLDWLFQGEPWHTMLLEFDSVYFRERCFVMISM